MGEGVGAWGRFGEVWARAHRADGAALAGSGDEVVTAEVYEAFRRWVAAEVLLETPFEKSLDIIRDAVRQAGLAPAAQVVPLPSAPPPRDRPAAVRPPERRRSAMRRRASPGPPKGAAAAAAAAAAACRARLSLIRRRGAQDVDALRERLRALQEEEFAADGAAIRRQLELAIRERYLPESRALAYGLAGDDQVPPHPVAAAAPQVFRTGPADAGAGPLLRIDAVETMSPATAESAFALRVTQP